MRRVAITGLGAVSALGPTVSGLREGLRAGRSAIGPLQNISAEGLRINVAAEVTQFDPAAHFEAKRLPLLDRFTQLALVAAREAVAGAGLSFEGELGRRTAVVVGTGIGGQATLEDAYRRFLGGGGRLHPLTIPRGMPNAPASHITIEHGITGPAWAVASACSSANHAIGMAFHLVRSGAAEAAVAGGAEACITPVSLKGWEALRVLADDTCRPFSRNRRGIVLGEGAGVVVLERMERARARGATIHAELAGFGMGADACDVLQPSAEGAARAIRAALDDARLDPGAVGYVNAHGTGTAANDAAETRALHAVFGAHAPRLMISSTKSMHGHALGAAGALELAATVLALRDGFLPPTVNYLAPDPECDLDYVPNAARQRTVEVAISNSFAFGGLNAVLAVRRFAG